MQYFNSFTSYSLHGSADRREIKFIGDEGTDVKPELRDSVAIVSENLVDLVD